MVVSKIKLCITVHGQYNETADSSLSQLWLLWSLDYYNWTTASYTNLSSNLFSPVIFKSFMSDASLYYDFINITRCIACTSSTCTSWLFYKVVVSFFLTKCVTRVSNKINDG